ncbi:MAG: hypothetical protein ABJH63_06000 [Rhizobiaceae bacterium]
MQRPFLPTLIAGLSALIISLASAHAADSHAGYYYPEPQTSETYISSLNVMPSMDKRSRIGFIIGLTKEQLQRAYAPPYHIFAKGFHAQKMIVVSSGSDRYNTLYRLRALLASLTSQARTSPLFTESRQPENLNFFDLARLAGFTQVTISDGDKLAHRINLLSAN